MMARKMMVKSSGREGYDAEAPPKCTTSIVEDTLYLISSVDADIRLEATQSLSRLLREGVVAAVAPGDTKFTSLSEVVPAIAALLRDIGEDFSIKVAAVRAVTDLAALALKSEYHDCRDDVAQALVTEGVTTSLYQFASMCRVSSWEEPLAQTVSALANIALLGVSQELEENSEEFDPFSRETNCFQVQECRDRDAGKNVGRTATECDEKIWSSLIKVLDVDASSDTFHSPQLARRFKAQIVALFRLLSEKKPNWCSQAGEGCLGPLSGMMTNQDNADRLKIDAALCLANLIRKGSNRSNMLKRVKPPVIPLLVSTIREAESGTNTPFLPAFLKLAGGFAMCDDSTTQLLLDQGILPALRSLLVDEGRRNSELQHEACWVVGNITAGSTTQIQMVLDEGLVPALFTCLMESDDREARESAVWSLLNVFSNRIDGQMDLVIGEAERLLQQREARIGTSARWDPCAVDIVSKLVRYGAQEKTAYADEFYDEWYGAPDSNDEDDGDYQDETCILQHRWVFSIPSAQVFSAPIQALVPAELVPGDLVDHCLAFLARTELATFEEDKKIQ